MAVAVSFLYKIQSQYIGMCARLPQIKRNNTLRLILFPVLCRAHKLQTIFPLYFVLQPHLLSVFSSPYNSGLSNKF